MIVDTSAVIAVLNRDDDWHGFLMRCATRPPEIVMCR